MVNDKLAEMNKRIHELEMQKAALEEQAHHWAGASRGGKARRKGLARHCIARACNLQAARRTHLAAPSGLNYCHVAHPRPVSRP